MIIAASLLAASGYFLSRFNNTGYGLMIGGLVLAIVWWYK